MKEGGIGGWADNKGQRRCVLHLLIPFLNEANILFILNHGIDDQRTRKDWLLQETHFLAKCKQTIPPIQGQPLPEGIEAACVLGEEMLTLVLILKGPA